MYLMSSLFFEKGGILFKGGHYLRKYGILGNDKYGMNPALIRNTFRTGVYNVKDYKQYYRLVKLY